MPRSTLNALLSTVLNGLPTSMPNQAPSRDASQEWEGNRINLIEA
jgi:hypothetical protein